MALSAPNRRTGISTDCQHRKSAKAALRTILDPATFPAGYKLHQRLVAVTFANPSCFTKAYAKTAWSFPDETLDGKKSEYLYTDENAYGSIYDSPAWQTAYAKKKEDEQKQADVDAFFSSLEQDNPALTSDVVQAPPSINLALCAPIVSSLFDEMQFSAPSDQSCP